MKKKEQVSISLDEFKRHTGALTKHFDDGIKLLGERIAGTEESLGKRLDKHEEILNSHTQKLDSHTQMIGQIMLDVAQIKLDLKQKVSIEDFARLEKRVIRLELARRS